MHKTSILQTPTGKFIFVGSIPEGLTVEKYNKAYQRIRTSKVYDTKQEAEKALAAA